MWQVIGQDHAVRQLKAGLELDRLSHAYLLVGPPHVGKRTLALNLAQAVNCTPEGDTVPYGQCSQCRRIAAGHHADVRVIGLDQGNSGSPQRREISIDDVRAVSGQAHLKPYEGACRVYIFEDAETMSEEAANALLKTLEEPPPQTLLILLTSQEDRLLPTISSRCRRIKLRPMPQEEIASYLEKSRSVEKGDAERLARLSRGSLGWALLALQDSLVLERRKSELDRLIGLLDAHIEQRFHAASDIASLYYRDRSEAMEVLDIWLTWWRDLLVMREGVEDSVYNQDYMDSLQQWSLRYSSRQITDFIGVILSTLKALDHNVNPRLSMEVLMLAIPGVGPRAQE